MSPSSSPPPWHLGKVQQESKEIFSIIIIIIFNHTTYPPWWSSSSPWHLGRVQEEASRESSQPPNSSPGTKTQKASPLQTTLIEHQNGQEHDLYLKTDSYFDKTIKRSSQFCFTLYRSLMNLRLESMWTLLSRGQLGTTCRWIEEYLRTTCGLLGDYLRTIWKQRGGFLRPTCWSFWNHFEATWCNLGHLWQLFCYLWPKWDHLMNILWLVVSYYCRSNFFFSLNFYCIYDLRIESIGRK